MGTGIIIALHFYECTNLIMTTSLGFSECGSVFRESKMTTILLDRLTHPHHLIETGNNSYSFKKLYSHHRKGQKNQID
ncbi:ATP-binding protein [Collimonas sp. NPDC087041]|uniref:ATP-binding protein n=1 Tax=Collimonas sp. NPDC087041 TaxID=3363960 RepID=UPI00380ECDB8